MPPARLSALKKASDARPTTPATETGPLSGTVWPSLISASDAPGLYGCAIAAPLAKRSFVTPVRNILTFMKFSSDFAVAVSLDNR
jgi:hypothetical protein